MNKLKSIYASACSATIAIIVITAMTIGAELSAPFKTWLTKLTGHHWVTKSWASIIVFILFYAVFRAASKSTTDVKTRKALSILQITTIVGFLAILGFYTYEFLAR